MNYSESLFQAAISRIPQTNYVTKTAAAANAFIEDVLMAPAQPKLIPTYENNKGQTTGKRHASESRVTKWESTLQNAREISSQNIGRYLLAVLGGYSVATLAVGVYKHTFKPLDLAVSQQLPVFSVIPQLAPAAGGINDLWASLQAAGLKMNSEGQGRIVAETDWKGSGEKVTPSGVNWATHVQGIQGLQDYFTHMHSALSVAEDADFTTCELLSWMLGISNTFADNDYGCPRFIDPTKPSKGVIRGHHLLSDTAFDYDFTLRLRANDPAYNLLIQQEETEIIHTLTGDPINETYNHELVMSMPLTKYSSVDHGFKEGYATVQVKPDPLLDVATNTIFKAELTNNIPSYVI